MSDDLISRKALFNELFVRNGRVCPNNDIDNFPINFNVKDVKQAIRNAPTAYDVDKVIEQLKELKTYKLNMADTMSEIMRRGELGTYVCLEDALEIVKSGGVAND